MARPTTCGRDRGQGGRGGLATSAVKGEKKKVAGRPRENWVHRGQHVVAGAPSTAGVDGVERRDSKAGLVLSGLRRRRLGSMSGSKSKTPKKGVSVDTVWGACRKRTRVGSLQAPRACAGPHSSWPVPLRGCACIRRRAEWLWMDRARGAAALQGTWPGVACFFFFCFQPTPQRIKVLSPPQPKTRRRRKGVQSPTTASSGLTTS